MSKKLTTTEFIERAIKIHGNKYDYSNVEYVTSREKVKIYCNVCHHEFYQRPDSHINKKDGCPICKINLNADRCRHTNEIFIKNAIYVHGNKFDYSSVEYINANTPVVIKCNKCGNIFNQRPSKHIHRKDGCPICKQSKGESKIQQILTKLNIVYIQEYSFDDCRYKYPLKFDFYIPKYNICIEYDGRHHFESVKDFGGDDEFVKIKIRDNIKTSYCNKNGIKLIRIPYTKFDAIEDILTQSI